MKWASAKPSKFVHFCVQFLKVKSNLEFSSKILLTNLVINFLNRFKGLGPTLIVCPATVLHQWVRELNLWFPLCKVAVLHSSGAHSGSKSALIKKMGEHRKFVYLI